MTYVAEFEVSGLVGRRGAVRSKLNRDVNVFFGVNGSGKTSLLRILHAALSTETRPLAATAFTHARVTIVDADQEYVATFTKPKQAQHHYEADLLSSGFAMREVVPSRQRLLAWAESAWTIQPDRKDAGRAWHHRYLPTSRLYAAADIAAWRPREVRDRITSEEELENVLAELLDRLWASYSAIVLGAAKRVQEQGLNSILRSVLAKKPKRAGSELDPDVAYQRAVSFLGDSAVRVLGSVDEFRRRFTEDPHMQIVIAQITRIDEEVEQLTVPRNRLQQLITDMFAGPKTVTFADNAIDVRGPDRAAIRLSALSSGEKQLLRILLETLSAGRSTIIIDEPEISMHVDWQRRLISAMRQLNPNCQIIVATHSPEVMAELDDDKIFQL